MQKPIDQHLITDYLLGAAAEDDTERLDELSLTDEQFVDRLQEAENDLVDAYVRGELSDEVQARFTSHYLLSPLRREKVKVARSFVDFVDRETPSAPVVPDRGTEKASWWRLVAVPRFATQWGFAALAILLLIGAGYLAYQNLRLRDQMTQAQSERLALEKREQELQTELEKQRASGAAIEQELTQVRERLTQLAPDESGQPKKPVVVAFNLAPQTRGPGQLPTVALPVEADVLSLNLRLEAIGSPGYEAVLKNSSGQTIWRSRRIKASRNGTALRLMVPADLLKSQNYIIELSSFSSTGQREGAGSYSFRVNRSN